ncbi:MAG TPA: SET domain-containing protein-lysine N-methyltransferase [Terrimicrobiaceae bacterium]
MKNLLASRPSRTIASSRWPSGAEEFDVLQPEVLGEDCVKQSNRSRATTTLTDTIPFVENICKSGIQLQATRFIPKGSVVLDFSDAIESVQTYQTVQTGNHRHVLHETLAKLNHSCAPSLIVDTRKRECRAARNIQPGDELNFFYPSTEWTMDEPFACSCASPQCIGQIQGAAFLKRSQLTPYWLNPHIEAQRPPARPIGDMMRSIREISLRIMRRISLDTADAHS